MRQSPSVMFAIKRTGNQFQRLMAVRHHQHPKCQQAHPHPHPHHNRAMTGMQHAVIGYVKQHGDPVFQRDIEQHFDVRRSTATGILQLMEKKELIRREPVEHDMRLKRIALTQKAIDAHHKASAEMEELEHSVTSGIPEEDLAIFFSVNERICQNIEALLAEWNTDDSNPDNLEDLT